MSDLVRGIVREKAPETPPAEAPTRPASRVPPTLRPARVASGPAPTVEPGPPPAVHAPAAPSPATPEAPGESAEALFGELVAFLGRVRDLLRTGEALRWDALEALVQRCLASLERSGELFWVANSQAVPANADPLAVHQARVALLSMRIGADVGYDRARLVRLGMAGALMDVGLWQLPEGVLKRLDALAGEELAQYRAHPKLSADLVRRWAPPSDALVEAVLHHHEREQGQGFPQGLDGGAIAPDAKILGLVDAYTGLTLPPPPRHRLRPHEAIREIVRSKHESFAPSLIKALLSEISVFPPGTLVRLNTGEIGRVVAVNRHHPLRPRVEIVADGRGQRLAAPKTTDLAEAPFLYVTGPVSEGQS